MDTFRIGDALQSSAEFEAKRLGSESAASAGDAFGEMVRGILDQTNEAQLKANENAELFAKGESGLVETVLSLNKADLSLRMLLEVRNKAIEAYRELTRAV